MSFLEYTNIFLCIPVFPLIVNESYERKESYWRLVRVPRRLKVGREGEGGGEVVFASERFVDEIDFSRWNRRRRRRRRRFK